MKILQYLSSKGRNPRILRIKQLKKTTTAVAKDLVKEKSATLLQGKHTRDVFGLLGKTTRNKGATRRNLTKFNAVKANMAEDTKTKLTEEELLAQMR